MSTQFGDKYRKCGHASPKRPCVSNTSPETLFKLIGLAKRFLSMILSQVNRVLPICLWPYCPTAITPTREACADMKTENWLNCHVHAFNYFGGVTRLLIPDNCKTATSSNTRYDTVLNRSYQELADYYGTAIVPARVRRPKDKSSAEASVRFAET